MPRGNRVGALAAHRLRKFLLLRATPYPYLVCSVVGIDKRPMFPIETYPFEICWQRMPEPQDGRANSFKNLSV